MQHCEKRKSFLGWTVTVYRHMQGIQRWSAIKGSQASVSGLTRLGIWAWFRTKDSLTCNNCDYKLYHNDSKTTPSKRVFGSLHQPLHCSFNWIVLLHRGASSCHKTGKLCCSSWRKEAFRRFQAPVDRGWSLRKKYVSIFSQVKEKKQEAEMNKNVVLTQSHEQHCRAEIEATKTSCFLLNFTNVAKIM